jgi:hypothetical protein
MGQECATEQEVTLSIGGDGTSEQVDTRFAVISLFDDFQGLMLFRLARNAIQARNFRNVHGGELEFQTLKRHPERDCGVYLRFHRPLRRGEKHEVSLTHTPRPGSRFWLVSPTPTMRQRFLAVRVWLPPEHIDAVERYSVRGFPMGELVTEQSGLPTFDDPACTRLYPNGSGFVGFEFENLNLQFYYGLIWKAVERNQNLSHMISAASGQ